MIPGKITSKTSTATFGAYTAANDREAFVPLPNGDRIKVRLVSRREKWMLGWLLALSLAVVFLLVKAI